MGCLAKLKRRRSPTHAAISLTDPNILFAVGEGVGKERDFILIPTMTDLRWESLAAGTGQRKAPSSRVTQKTNKTASHHSHRRPAESGEASVHAMRAVSAARFWVHIWPSMAPRA